VKVQAGLQNQSDSYDGVIFGVADMAGVFLTGSMEPVSYKLGWAKWQDPSSTKDDDVDLYVAEVKFSPTKEAKLGVNLYLLRDASGESSPVAGNINLTSIVNRIGPQYGFTVTSFTYQPSSFYFIGLDGSIQAGPVALSGWAFYNFGKIEKVNAAGTLFSAPLVNEDLDVKGWAAALRGDLNLGPGKFFLGVGYVSGSGENDSDYKGIITGENYATAGSYPFYKWDMQILFPNGDDITDSAALAYGVGNNGRGILGAAAGYSQKFSDMLSGKVGLGYLADAKNTLGSNAGGVSISKHKAFEVNANVNYALLKGLDLGLYGAYAFLTDWEDYGAQTITVADVTKDADNVYKAYVRLNYAF